MIEKVIKHYKNLSDKALMNLEAEKNFKIIYDEKLINNNIAEFKKIDSSKMSDKLISDYKRDMRKMIDTANLEYRKTLNKLKATTDEVTKQKILANFADTGIIGFTSKNGARWNIETYSNMYTRHVNNECARNYVINIAQEQGKDKVKISNHGTKCELCKPYEGKILTFEELEYAKSKGLFHPNCLHICLFVVERIVK